MAIHGCCMRSWCHSVCLCMYASRCAYGSLKSICWPLRMAVTSAVLPTCSCETMCDMATLFSSLRATQYRTQRRLRSEMQPLLRLRASALASQCAHNRACMRLAAVLPLAVVVAGLLGEGVQLWSHRHRPGHAAWHVRPFKKCM